MQRKQIKVGERYGVVPAVGKHSRPVAATVVGFDATYGTWNGGRRVTKRDGIQVRFDEPVVAQWDRFAPAVGRLSGRSDVISETVVSSRQVVAPWAEIEERRRKAEEASAKNVADAADAAERFAPRLADLRVRLSAIGIETKIHDDGSGLYAADPSTRLSISFVRREGRAVAFGDVKTDFALLSRLLAEIAEASA